TRSPMGTARRAACGPRRGARYSDRPVAGGAAAETSLPTRRPCCTKTSVPRARFNSCHSRMLSVAALPFPRRAAIVAFVEVLHEHAEDSLFLPARLGFPAFRIGVPHTAFARPDDARQSASAGRLLDHLRIEVLDHHHKRLLHCRIGANLVFLDVIEGFLERLAGIEIARRRRAE